MTPLKQQLEQWIEKEAEIAYAPVSNGCGGIYMFPEEIRAFKAGAQSLAPLLLAAVDGLRAIEDPSHMIEKPADGSGTRFATNADRMRMASDLLTLIESAVKEKS